MIDFPKRFLFLLSLFSTLLFSEESVDTYTKGGKEYSVGLTLGYTLWYPSEDGLVLYYNTTPENREVGASVVYPKINAQSGFQFLLDCSLGSVDLSGKYSWFANLENPYNRQSIPTSGDNNDNFKAVWPTQDISTITTFASYNFIEGNASGAWNNLFQRIDILLGRLFGVGKYFDLKPFVGLTGAWDNQELQVSYGWKQNADYKVTEWVVTQDWWGIGPYLGFAPNYFLWKSTEGKGFFLIAAKCGTTLAWSSVEGYARQYVTDTTIDTNNPTASYKDLSVKVSAALDTSLGISWDTVFGNFLRTNIFLGWDQSVWFSHSHIFVPFGSGYFGKGIYSMQGLTLSFALGF